MLNLRFISEIQMPALNKKKKHHLQGTIQPWYRKILLSATVLLALLYACTSLALAQDDHYWAQQYGATATLMGGAMTGGVEDNSAVYYNPGVLAFINNPSLSVDANVYRMDKILITDGAGKDMNLNSAQLSVYPQIIAGMVNLLKNSRFRFAYTMLTRNHGNVLMNARYAAKNSPNGETAVTSYIGVYDYINQLNEQWFGMGIGYRISGKLGIGATFISSYRGQSYQLTNYVQEVEQNGMQNVFRTQTNDEAINYSTFRLLTKFGLSYTEVNWKLGLTLTTPSVGLYGKGDVQRQNSVITVSDDPSDMKDNFLIMDRKTGVEANYRHPLSIAFGSEYHTDKTRLAFSAEYFFRIGVYHLFETDAEPFVYPPSYIDSAKYKPLIDSYLHVEMAARPVLNVGIGFSQKVYKKLTLLMGAYTDFSSFDKPDEANELLHGFGGFDAFHVSAGLSYHQTKQSITVGVSYAQAPSKKVPPYAIINQTPEFTDKALLTAHTFAIVLGYTYYFAKFSD
jgi:hypothetical protein